jgi:hypothetical protein
LIITNERTGRRYRVGKRVAETESYRIYLCQVDGEPAEYLLQVASTGANNASLDRAAYVLNRLLEEADSVEAEYTLVKGNPKHFLNYQLCFPELIDTFVSVDQGNRRVNILRFRGVEEVSDMVPLHNLVHRDKLRVDLKTSVWIMGKLLKILTFVHDAKISVGNLSLGNILIEPTHHYTVIFHWADAHVGSDGVSKSVIREEIKRSARSVIEVLGGNLERGIPDDGSEEFSLYSARLLELASFGESSAHSAHKAFYALVDELWPRGFHQFTTYPR